MSKYKPKPMKNTKIKYDGKEYKNIISINKGYDYGYFSYLDDKGSECCVYPQNGTSFEIIESK